MFCDFPRFKKTSFSKKNKKLGTVGSKQINRNKQYKHINNIYLHNVF
jgi:hypothetical protein